MNVSTNITENETYIKKTFSFGLNFDFVFRDFEINLKGKKMKGFLIFYDGMVRKDFISDDILEPLLFLSKADIKEDRDDKDIIKNSLISMCNLTECNDFDTVLLQVNYGGVGIFIDTLDVAFTADVKGFSLRSISKPISETIIRGPQEGFIESIMINLSLVRKIIRSEKLIVERAEVGKISKTSCGILYISDLTNNDLVNEVRRRIEGIDVDYIFDSGELEQLIEDFNFLPTPQIMSTERPDMVANCLAEGYVALLLDGSPYALILPINAFKLIQTTEDKYLRYPYTIFVRLIRIAGLLLALLLPAVFIALTNYHNDSIPTGFLFTIASSRERVPFSNVPELILLELAFELVREAILRVPSPIGSTIGIIGALIIGQASVEANLVSPLLLIITAITGIGSFAIPDYSLSYSFRILKYVYIILASVAGFVGISFAIFIHVLILVDANSFGMPFLSPISPLDVKYATGTLFSKPIINQEKRSKFLKPKHIRKQGKFSRAWAEGSSSLFNSEENEE